MSSLTAVGIVTSTVKIKGEPLPGKYSVQRIHIVHAINRIATATLTILDGSASDEGFAISASEAFVPGNAISLEAGYDGINTVLFQGIVTQQALRIESYSGPLLEVTCKVAAVKMTVGRKSANYSQSTDSDVINQLVSTAGLTASVTSTDTV
ncbi:hypothetical protein, partial [Pseudomonas syringae]